MLVRIGMQCALMAALILGTASGASAADDGVWSVSKSSGEVWLATSGTQQVSLNQQETLKPGDTIRTGRNGRVLLVRGEETILISPNSVVGVPAEKKEGLSTTIIQQAGSILLEVEKRNVKHFEVETPYLAAVVKGTHFSVTVGAGSTKVGVLRGQVEVSDFRTGQIAQVMPGQAATAFEHGKPGLSLSGAGTFSPIEQGKPRASTIERVPVPKLGLSIPRHAANGHALGTIDKGSKTAGAPARSRQSSETHTLRTGVVRISSSLGEVKLNFHKVTHGLAHDTVAPGRVRNANASSDTVWSDSKSSTTTTAANSSTATAVAVSSSAPASSATSTSLSVPTSVAAAASSNNATDGSSGSGTSGNAATGNGNSGNGNSGNGNGNSGNNGNHYGWYKHH
ncbi:FecR family protein [Bradyrhizobium ganzhouense]|uniref:FecR family protein n=1 Tax=Bradyrhizobium ganzhouense TaxID=1179767 RepID=UPI003CEAD9CD